MSSFDISTLVRANIRELSPYTSARDDFQGEATVFLDANENSIGSVTDKVFNRYPDPLQWTLKEKLAKIKGVKPEQIFLGNGSDEAIDLLFRAFCEPKIDKAIILPPTYGMYKVQANINNTPIIEIQLNNDFSLPVNKIKKHDSSDKKLIFICSPNNPTGNLMSKDDIKQVLSSFKGLVIVDEAYIDFAPEGSMVPELDNYPNLVVLQTFSKAWGMAGLRLGMAFASKEIINIFNKIKYPYNVSEITQQYAIQAVNNVELKNRMVDTLLKEKVLLIEELNKIDSVKTIYHSDANFVLVNIEKATDIYNKLINLGIVVRNRSNVALCNDSLRITIGTKEENKKLIDELKKLVK